MLRKKEVFVKILACFMACVMTLMIVFCVIEIFRLKRFEDIAVENLNIKFESSAEDMQRMLSQMRQSLSELAVKLSVSEEFSRGTYIENNKLRADMREILVDRRQNEFSEFLTTVFIVDKRDSAYVYELTGTVESDVFFGTLYADDTYNAEFWLSQMSATETFAIFPESVFSVVRDSESSDVKLVPVSFKANSDSRYIIVALLDSKAIEAAYGISTVYSADGEVLLCAESVVGISDEIISDSSLDVRGGKVFSCVDEHNGGIRIVRFVSKDEMNDLVRKADTAVFMVGILVFLITVAFAVIVSFVMSKKIESLSEELLKNSAVKTKFEFGLRNLNEISEAVRIIAAHDIRNATETNNKESVLDSVFLQSRMRDVYVGAEAIEAKIDISRPFYMIYFNVKYKKEFREYIGKEAGKATFFLMQLIEMYLESWGIKATTFQVENNGIVSVFDAEDELFEEKDIVNSIVSKLSNESEYAFFTVAVSKRYEGIDHLKKAYDNLLNVAKYRKPTEETQILYGNEVKTGGSRFYFSVEEMGKLSALIQNGTEEELYREFDEILEYNLKKEINSFELYLLCTEVINCAVKLMNRVLHAVPQEVNLSDVYHRLENACVPDESREICVGFLCEAMGYVRENKREDDYIISYILDYVDNHYAEDIYLNLFAEKLKLTGAYISSYFKEKMNVNLSDYVNNYRIKKALELSENPQNKNKDIAVMVGLPNINTFIRLFKKYTGYTPGEYRKKHFGEDYKN